MPPAKTLHGGEAEPDGTGSSAPVLRGDLVMAGDVTSAESERGYLAEFEFISEGMRQDQKERSVLLGITFASHAALAGLLLRSSQAPSASSVFLALGLVGLVTAVGQALSVRATIGVASGGQYLRTFVEPHVVGLAFQSRNPAFLRTARLGVSASQALAVAYIALSVAQAAAWWSVDLGTERQLAQTIALITLVLVNLTLGLALGTARNWGTRRVEAGWKALALGEEREGRAAGQG